MGRREEKDKCRQGMTRHGPLRSGADKHIWFMFFVIQLRPHLTVSWTHTSDGCALRSMSSPVLDGHDNHFLMFFSPFEVAVFASSPCLGMSRQPSEHVARVPCPSAPLVALARSSGGILAIHYAPHYASSASDNFLRICFSHRQRPTVKPPRVSFAP